MKPLGVEEIAEKLNSINRIDMWCASTTSIDNFLCEFVNNLNPKPDGILEIGTMNGLSTITLASIGRIVYTWDVANRNAEYIWGMFPEIRQKISAFTGPQDILDYSIKELIQYYKKIINFNFAFIDGLHTYNAVKHDFELVKSCGRVLFHDCVRGVADFVFKELKGYPVHTQGNYGYWENK